MPRPTSLDADFIGLRTARVKLRAVEEGDRRVQHMQEILLAGEPRPNSFA